MPAQDKPGEPHPKFVVITEHSKVEGYGGASANERMPNSAQRPSEPVGSNGINTPNIPHSEVHTALHWSRTQKDEGFASRIMPGADLLVVECDVDAFGEAIAPQYGDALAEVNIAYKVVDVTAFTGKIEITGTTAVGNDMKVLTGQGLHAKVTDCTLVTATIPAWSFATGNNICFGHFDQGAIGAEIPVNFGVLELDFSPRRLDQLKSRRQYRSCCPIIAPTLLRSNRLMSNQTNLQRHGGTMKAAQVTIKARWLLKRGGFQLLSLCPRHFLAGKVVSRK